MSDQHSAALEQYDATNPAVLTEIYDPNTNIVTWKRALDNTIHKVAKAIVREEPNFQTRIIGSVKGVSQSLFENLPDVDDREDLIADTVVLVDMFSELFELDRVGLRMSVLTKAMCPKFHVDRVPCRLVTTYTGAGTEWLTNADVSRSAEKGIAQIPGSTIQETYFGEVTLLKGEAWDGNEGKGIVHRSPSADADSARLVLTLDFA
ncbi:DUF1826 domain-containing protein [Sessilibacter corallicola]|uniref:DUF1826 domain-containing protein n=1 Tax=Sessilibacter corallicola TaxID=2904075 RepID=A0ABQ0AEG7_9GAMM